MYFDTRIEYEYEMMNEMIESEMHKIRRQAIEKLSSYLVHPQNFLTKDFALTLAYGYFDSHEPAENIAKAMDLGKLEFLSIMNDFDAFKEEYLRNYEEAQNF